MELQLFNTKPLKGAASQPDSLDLNFDRLKVISHLVILSALIVFGVAAILGPSGGREEEEISWLVSVILISMPGYLIVRLLLEQRLERPILRLTQEGFFDRRQDRDWVSWPEVEEASPKRQLLMRGVKIVLSDGSRADVDMTFLQGTPRQVIEFIQQAARKGADEDETADR